MRRLRTIWLVATVCASIVIVFQPFAVAGHDNAEDIRSVDDQLVAAQPAKGTNVTSGDPPAMNVDLDPSTIDFVPDPPPMRVVPVVGNVSICKGTVNLSASAGGNESVAEEQGSEGAVGVLTAGTITVHGRIVYENILTSESVGTSNMPKTSHPYQPNMNPASGAKWEVFGRPGATSVSLFFSEIQIEQVYDHLYIKNQWGTIEWQSSDQTYTNLWVTISGNKATIEMYSDGSVQYDGFELTKFVPDQNHWIGVPHVPVMIYDDDTWSGDDLLATPTTDSYGYFSASGISNDDPEGGTQDVYLYIESTSDHARVIMNGGSVYSMQSEKKSNVPDGDVDFSNQAPIEAENSAWIIYSNLMDTWNTFYYGGPSYNCPSLKGVWTLGHSAIYGVGCDSTSHHDYSGLLAGEIHLASEDGQDVDTIVHEAGHHLMYEVYGGWCPAHGDHTYTSSSPADLAWTEGWADFVPGAVGLYTSKNDAYYDLGGGFRNGVFFNMEPSERIPSGTYPGLGGWVGGDTEEATISYALFDIYDLNDDGLDSYDGGLNGVWTVLDDRHISDFSDFYDAFREHYKGTPATYNSCLNAIKQGSRGTISYDPVVFYEDCADISDWTLSQIGGTVSLDSDPSLAPMPTPCMKLQTTSPSPGEISATHQFPTQGGDFVVDVKVRPDSTSGYYYVWVQSYLYFGAYMAFKDTGAISYFDSSWHDVGTFSAGTWYQLTLSIHASSGTYDIYVNGGCVKTDAAFYSDGGSSEHYLNAVRFRAGYAGQANVKFWVDEITIRGGSALFFDQFVQNLAGWTQVETAGPVDQDNSVGSWIAPSVKLYRQTTDPAKQCQAFHSVSASAKTDGRVFIEARISVDTIASWKWCYVNLYDSGSTVETYLCLRDGHIDYYTGSWVQTTFSYSAGAWFKIGLDADLETGTYDIYANGVKIVSGAPLWDSGTAHNILTVGLQAGAANLSDMTLHCDDISVTWR